MKSGLTAITEVIQVLGDAGVKLPGDILVTAYDMHEHPVGHGEGCFDLIDAGFGPALEEGVLERIDELAGSMARPRLARARALVQLASRSQRAVDELGKFSLHMKVDFGKGTSADKAVSFVEELLIKVTDACLHHGADSLESGSSAETAHWLARRKLSRPTRSRTSFRMILLFQKTLRRSIKLRLSRP